MSLYEPVYTEGGDTLYVMDQVSVKATRGEKLGFIGHEEGAAAQAIVLLEKKEG